MKLRRTLIDIPSVEVDPADLAESWRRAAVEDCPPDLAIVLEGSQDDVQQYDVEVDFDRDWVASHKIERRGGTWTPSGEVLVRQKPATGEGEREVDAHPEAAGSSKPSERQCARAGMDSHLDRIQEFLRLCTNNPEDE